MRAELVAVHDYGQYGKIGSSVLQIVDIFIRQPDDSAAAGVYLRSTEERWKGVVYSRKENPFFKGSVNRGEFERWGDSSFDDIGHCVHVGRQGWALADILYVQEHAIYHGVFANRGWEVIPHLYPRALIDFKIVSQVAPLHVGDCCVDLGSYERQECYNTKHPLGSKVLALLSVMFLLGCCVSFFKVFDRIPKWNEWVVFGIATASGLGIVAGGCFVFLILGGLC